VSMFRFRCLCHSSPSRVGGAVSMAICMRMASKLCVFTPRLKR
ncbi:aldehyde dehydrogenase family protein, partial [Vibrio parahaemolyticus V-223/04]